MYLFETQTGDVARGIAASAVPFGPGFAPEVVQKTETVEIWAAEFNDTGGDFCEFRALDTGGRIIARKRLNGF